jgi:hypothetical protein
MPEHASKVLRYFLLQPRAADTLDGLLRWRLPGGTARNRRGDVARALRWLVAEGHLRAERRRAVGVIFSLDRRKAPRPGRGIRGR